MSVAMGRPVASAYPGASYGAAPVMSISGRPAASMSMGALPAAAVPAGYGAPVGYGSPNQMQLLQMQQMQMQQLGPQNVSFMTPAQIDERKEVDLENNTEAYAELKEINDQQKEAVIVMLENEYERQIAAHTKLLNNERDCQLAELRAQAKQQELLVKQQVDARVMSLNVTATAHVRQAHEMDYQRKIEAAMLVAKGGKPTKKADDKKKVDKVDKVDKKDVKKDDKKKDDKKKTK